MCSLPTLRALAEADAFMVANVSLPVDKRVNAYLANQRRDLAEDQLLMRRPHKEKMPQSIPLLFSLREVSILRYQLLLLLDRGYALLFFPITCLPWSYESPLFRQRWPQGTCPGWTPLPWWKPTCRGFLLRQEEEGTPSRWTTF